MSEPKFALPTLKFGEVIAFLLPGFAVLRAVAYVSPSVQQMWSSITSTNNGLGIYAMAVLFSLAGGLGVSTVRAAIESALLKIPWMKSRYSIDYSLLNDNNEKRFDEAVRQTYRYAQFAGNMSLAILALFLARSIVAPWDTLMSILVVATIILFFCAVVSTANSLQTVRKVLGHKNG